MLPWMHCPKPCPHSWKFPSDKLSPLPNGACHLSSPRTCPIKLPNRKNASVLGLSSPVAPRLIAASWPRGPFVMSLVLIQFHQPCVPNYLVGQRWRLQENVLNFCLQELAKLRHVALATIQKGQRNPKSLCLMKKGS